ncbi:hypothetical protein Hanom_Chr01g00034171 [Helianthus anomalus]
MQEHYKRFRFSITLEPACTSCSVIVVSPPPVAGSSCKSPFPGSRSNPPLRASHQPVESTQNGATDGPT